MFAHHTSPTQCAHGCKCGADLTNAVHACRDAVAAADAQLIALRNSGVSEEAVQAAQTARHDAQERLDAAFRAFVAFADSKPVPLPDGAEAEAEAVLTDEELESGDDEDEDEGEGGAGRIDDLVGSEDDDDEDDDASYREDSDSH